LGHDLSPAAVEVIYLAGGATGALLDELLDQHGLERFRIPIRDHTRQSLAVYERVSGKEFRFVPDGPLIREAEWQAAFDRVAGLDHGWLVASGSLPRGVPVDFYARLAAGLAGRDVRLVVDTSGPALAAALEQGGLYLVKPSLGEFETLVGASWTGRRMWARRPWIWCAPERPPMSRCRWGTKGGSGPCGRVIVRPALDVLVKSATGAGDSSWAVWSMAFCATKMQRVHSAGAWRQGRRRSCRPARTCATRKRCGRCGKLWESCDGRA
jgi:6-phosphofructokinase 2